MSDVSPWGMTSLIGSHYENYASLHFIWKLVQLYNNVRVLIAIVPETEMAIHPIAIWRSFNWNFTKSHCVEQFKFCHNFAAAAAAAIVEQRLCLACLVRKVAAATLIRRLYETEMTLWNSAANTIRYKFQGGANRPKMVTHPQPYQFYKNILFSSKIT